MASLVAEQGLSGTQASGVVAHGLSCPSAGEILVPRPGIKPMSPALVGRFLNIGPPVLYLVAQSFQTLCNPMDCSPLGSSVHGDSPSKNTGVGCHAFLQAIFPTQGLNSHLLHPFALAGMFFTTESPGKPLAWKCYYAVLSHV